MRRKGIYLSDTSKRTNAAQRAYNVLIIAAIVMIVSVLGYIAGTFKYNSVVAGSSTAIGTEMNFKRSGADCQLSGLYTDKAGSVLIARISFNSAEDSLKMPSRGSDYAAFISSDAIPKDTKSVSMLTGRLSSDGDMFVILPKPDPESVYSIFLMNTNYLGDVTTSADTDITGDIKLDEDSLTAALSNYNYADAVKSPENSAYTIANDNTDAIGFRLTMKPSLDDELHKPTVLNTDKLLSDTGEFDFEQFFQSVFIDSAQVSINNAFNAYVAQERALTKQRDEMQSRLELNPNDTQARERYNDIAKSLQNLNSEKQNAADLLESYKNLVYSDNMFANLSTKAQVLAL